MISYEPKDVQYGLVFGQIKVSNPGNLIVTGWFHLFQTPNLAQVSIEEARALFAKTSILPWEWN